MTEPRRWPRKAEDHRREAIAKVMVVLDLVDQAKRVLVEEGDILKTMALLLDIAIAAKGIQEELNEARKGRE